MSITLDITTIHDGLPADDGKVDMSGLKSMAKRTVTLMLTTYAGQVFQLRRLWHIHRQNEVAPGSSNSLKLCGTSPCAGKTACLGEVKQSLCADMHIS